ncbi:MAG: TadE/TadG family type IV pilus assembly protein [bacterium]|nr:TadE/TadG family type IV pilus assembly protein [bacterium]
MNKKGQALIEFIIILPIFIMIMLAVFDYVRIYSEKSNLESVMEDVVLSNELKDDNITLLKELDDEKTKYTLNKSIDIYSPVISVILGNKYVVSVSRTIYE